MLGASVGKAAPQTLLGSQRGFVDCVRGRRLRANHKSCLVGVEMKVALARIPRFLTRCLSAKAQYKWTEAKTRQHSCAARSIRAFGAVIIGRWDGTDLCAIGKRNRARADPATVSIRMALSNEEAPGRRHLVEIFEHPCPRSSLEQGRASHGCEQRKETDSTARSGGCLQRRVDPCPKSAFLKALRALLGERLHRGRSRIPPWQRRQGPWASWVSLSLS
jgi:hypothetical protein